MSQTITMTVHYIDGTEQVFSWEPDPNQVEPATMVSRLQKSLHEEQLLLDLGDQLMIIPKHNVKIITLNSVPAQLPSTAIRGAQLVN